MKVALYVGVGQGESGCGRGRLLAISGLTERHPRLGRVVVKGRGSPVGRFWRARKSCPA